MLTMKSMRGWALQEKCKPLKEKFLFIGGFCKVGLKPVANFQKKKSSLWSSEALYLAQGCAAHKLICDTCTPLSHLQYLVWCDGCYHTMVYRTQYVRTKHMQNMLDPHSTLLLIWAVNVVEEWLWSCPIWVFVCFSHHGNCPESLRNVHRHLLYANSCQINHCILQHNPWGGLYLWNLLLSLHFATYLNHVIHSARRMNVSAWGFNPSLLRIWFSEREQKREQEIQRKKLKVRVKYHYFSALGLGKGCIIKASS